MLRSYLTIAFRNLVRNSFYSVINIGGLAAGIACSILIMLWVYDELSFDSFHKNSDRLSQTWLHAQFSDKINSYRSVPLPVYEYLKTADARIKNTAVTDWGGPHLLLSGDTRVNKQGFYVSPEFLEMFQFPLSKGEASSVLDDISSIVISESLAKAMFGDKDPVNQLIRVDNKTDFKVTGVLKDIPSNSSFRFDFLLPWAVNAQQGWIKNSLTQWDNESFQVFVELQPGADRKEVEAGIANLIHEKVPENIRTLFLHPLEDWRLKSTYKDGVLIGGMYDYVKLFSAIAVFILVIACINFMNLATARSERRAREVGVRKAVGSRRSELISQFLGESFIISAFAFFIALLVVQMILPLYNDLVQKELSIQYSSPWVWMIAATFIIFTSLFAGSYPAFYLSSFNPVNVLKGKLHLGTRGVAPRKILVSLQFFFSILLIGATFVIYQQINFVKSRDVGYDKENLIMVSSNEELAKNYKSLRQELLSSGLVKSMTTSSSPITEIYGNNTLGWAGKPESQSVLFSRVSTEYDYTKTMGIKVLEGRDFSQDFKSDTSAMILNQAALDVMGIQNPIGEQIDLWGKKWHVVGIVDNPLMTSPFREVQPGFFLLDPDWLEIITMRLEASNDRTASMKQLENIYKKYNPSYPFEYKFVDDEYDRKFASIEMIGTLSNLFAVLAIFITCLGLYGLAAFTAEQRIKEIGIRKVMGASTGSIVSLLSKDFAYLVLIGFSFAAPLAWWGLNNFLERYDYRISLTWWVIPLAGAIALVLVLIIVSTQAFRASQANPSDSLRSE
ncbi:MAG: FtsX-like permease family protein [Cyclobacteriaceae bacterium]|nr:FtsX-like permease family protein [Cyclobacteriaceae bacterium]